MSLFNATNIATERDKATLWKTDHGCFFINAASLKQFKATLIPFEKNKQYHFSTGGQWSLHELLGFLLGITGPCDVYISTWAITEEPARTLLDWKQAGLIKELYGIFDFKIRDQKSEAFVLCEKFFTKIHLTKCHAKVIVLQNEEWQVSIITSANFTRNPRIERGIICTDSATAASDINWMQGVMKDEKYFSVRKNAIN